MKTSPNIKPNELLKYLVIHCSATPEGKHFTIDDITRWHTSPPPAGRGWKQVGYSDVIYLDGTLINLVPYNRDMRVDPWEITNGVRGINSISRHIVYIGGTDSKHKPKDTRTPQQLQTLTQFCQDWIKIYPNTQIAGHNQFDKGKACPSFDVPNWLRSIKIPESAIYKL